MFLACEVARQEGIDWPEYIFTPLDRALAELPDVLLEMGGQQAVDEFKLYSMDETVLVVSAGLTWASWRMTQGIYRFDPALLTEGFCSTQEDSEPQIEDAARIADERVANCETTNPQPPPTNTPGTVVTTNPPKKRRHVLDHELDVAIKKVGLDTDAVWSELTRAAIDKDSNYPALYGFTDGGIQYCGKLFQERGEPDVLTRKQCGCRLKRRRDKDR